MRHEVVGDVDGVDFAFLADQGREDAGEQPRAGSDVGDFHPGLELQGCDDLFAMVVDVSSFPFEAFDELRDVGIFKALVDPRFDAFLLGEERQCRSKEEDHRQDGAEHGILPDSQGGR